MEYTTEPTGEELPLLDEDMGFAANQMVLLSTSKGKYTILQDRLQKLVEKCDPERVIFTSPLLDTEAPYVDGSECGFVTTEALIDKLRTAVEAGKIAVANGEDNNAVLGPLCDAIEQAFAACAVKNNPIQDGGYYYIIHGFAADANTAGTGLGLTYSSADNYV